MKGLEKKTSVTDFDIQELKKLRILNYQSDEKVTKQFEMIT
jgi:hypothetical protein